LAPAEDSIKKIGANLASLLEKIAKAMRKQHEWLRAIIYSINDAVAASDPSRSNTILGQETSHLTVRMLVDVLREQVSPALKLILGRVCSLCAIAISRILRAEVRSVTARASPVANHLEELPKGRDALLILDKGKFPLEHGPFQWEDY
jgi:hypothetical protein